MKKDIFKLIIWSCAFILIASIAFFTYNPSKQKDNKQQNNNNKQFDLFDAHSNTISKININTDNINLSLFKNNNIWKIKQNQNIDIDSSYVGRWLNTFFSLKTNNSFEIKDKDLEQFGLNTKKPTFSASNDKDSFSLTIGDRTPDEISYYAISNQQNSKNKILTISSASIDGNQRLEFTTKQFRNKDFMKIKPNDISYIVLNNNTKFIKTKTAIAHLPYLPDYIRLPKYITFDKNKKILTTNSTISFKQKQELENLASKSDTAFINSVSNLYSNSNQDLWSIQNPKAFIDTSKVSSFVKNILNIRAQDFPEYNNIPSSPKNDIYINIVSKKTNKSINIRISLFNSNSYVYMKNNSTLYQVRKDTFDMLNKTIEYFYLK